MRAMSRKEQDLTGFVDRRLLSTRRVMSETVAPLSAGVARSGPQVCLYECNRERLRERHERAGHLHVAAKLAEISGGSFTGDYGPDSGRHGPLYVVPNDTLVQGTAPGNLAIRSEDNLFGGLVPYPFMATKAISHRLFNMVSAPPAGWSTAFGIQVADIVLNGYSTFSAAEARRAAMHLLRAGPVRLKAVNEAGGHGQQVVRTAAELDAALAGATIDACHGLVVEEEIFEPTTFSIGQVRVGGLVASYHGIQHITRDNLGNPAYGGSDLFIVRGGFDDLLRTPMHEDARLAITQAMAYDRAAETCFHPFLASRRNYDVILGLDSKGARKSGVLEQSWRIGGASIAEVAALEVLKADPRIASVNVSCVEAYGNSTVPADAQVYFCDTDDDVGRITKYTLVERNGPLPVSSHHGR